MLLKDSTRKRQNLQPQRVFSSSPHSPAAQQMQTQVGISPRQLFHYFFLNPGIWENSGAWFYSSSRTHLWDMNLCSLKLKVAAVGAGCRRCLESFIPVSFCPRLLMDLPDFSSPTPKSGNCGAQFHWDRVVTSPGAALLVPFHCGPSLGQEQGPTNCYYFPKACRSSGGRSKTPHFPARKEKLKHSSVCVVPCQALELHLPSQTFPLFLINVLRNFKM